jgi:unsaturated rhamnogalacturonyl hydrolase
MELIEKYIEYLISQTTPQKPVWNIEKILEGKEPTWNYIDGCMIKAVLELYYVTENKKYLEFADTFIDWYINEDGTVKTFDIDEYNLDNINEGKVLFDLFKLTGKAKYRKALDTIYEQLEKHPRIKEGNFWHKKIYPNQVWLDGLYMCLPFYIEYDTNFKKCAGYDDVYNQIFTVEKRMKDQATGLYRHAYDESKEMFWCDKASGLSQHVWLRAMGWFVMALVDVLEKTDAKAAGGKDQRVAKIFKDTMDALLKYQDKSGMWYQVVDYPDKKGNYLETSGSAILSYALLKGSRLGYLGDSYRKAGEKAFHGICEKYLTEKDGHLSLGGICLVAGLGGKGMRDGSFDYYMSEPVVENEAKGVAPLLLAYTEMVRL